MWAPATRSFAFGAFARAALWLAVAATALAALSFGYRGGDTSLTATQEPDRIARCIDRYTAAVGSSAVDWPTLYTANTFCYHLVGSQLVMNEQAIRGDNFIYQRYQNGIILWMVVAITISGVFLAGLQLLASYNLAVAGRGALAESGSVDIRPDRVVVNSSVIGVVILAISFGFFLVYVLYVYTIIEPSTSATSPAAPAAYSAPEGSNIGVMEPAAANPEAPARTD